MDWCGSASESLILSETASAYVRRCWARCRWSGLVAVVDRRMGEDAEVGTRALGVGAVRLRRARESRVACILGREAAVVQLVVGMGCRLLVD